MSGPCLSYASGPESSPAESAESLLNVEAGVVFDAVR